MFAPLRRPLNRIRGLLDPATPAPARSADPPDDLRVLDAGAEYTGEGTLDHLWFHLEDGDGQQVVKAVCLDVLAYLPRELSLMSWHLYTDAVARREEGLEGSAARDHQLVQQPGSGAAQEWRGRQGSDERPGPLAGWLRRHALRLLRQPDATRVVHPQAGAGVGRGADGAAAVQAADGRGAGAGGEGDCAISWRCSEVGRGNRRTRIEISDSCHPRRRR